MENKKQELNEQELETVNAGWSVEYDGENKVITFKLDLGDDPLQSAIAALTANNINITPYLGQLMGYYQQYGENLTNGTYTSCKIYLENVDEANKTANIVKVEVF